MRETDLTERKLTVEEDIYTDYHDVILRKVLNGTLGFSTQFYRTHAKKFHCGSKWNSRVNFNPLSPEGNFRVYFFFFK